ncbi:LOW QUALITY PROTEIN: mitochondrial import inner membrane translocase subunit Tim23, partial [Salvelinus alpinus]
LIILPQDPDDLILPTDANKVRGRFELAFFTIGGCSITGFPYKVKHNFNGLLNLVTHQGATWANTLGSLAWLYSVFGVAIEKARGAEDDINTVAAGTMKGGVRGPARGGLALSSLYNNWDHLKGNPPTRY